MPFTAISRSARGTYEWAMDQLAAGNQVRRYGWPIELRTEPSFADGVEIRPWSQPMIWRVYPTCAGIGPCKGFNPGIIGADNDSWGYLGTDSSLYAATKDDEEALDWQLVSDVTPAQIEEMDKHRWPRVPREVVWARLDEEEKKQQAFENKILIGLTIIAVISFLLAIR